MIQKQQTGLDSGSLGYEAILLIRAYNERQKKETQQTYAAQN